MIKKIIKKLIKKDSKLYFHLYYSFYWKPNYPSIQHLLNAYSKKNKNIFFIQIGANDGISGDVIFSGDPIYKFIKRDNWSGILVEPVKYLYDKLVSNYKQDNLIFENIAISSKDEVKDFYYVKEPDEHIPWWCNQLNSFNKDSVYDLKYKFPGIEKYIVCEKMNCITLDTLLKKHNVSDVNVLHIDTEGYDFEIIKTINFNKLSPDLIFFEHVHLKKEDYTACINLLKENKYTIIKEELDTLAFKGERIPKRYLN